MLQNIQGCFSECSKLPERLLATDLCAVRSLNERMYNAHDKATSRSCSISRCVGGNQSVKKINGSVLSGRHSAVNLYVFRVQRVFVFIWRAGNTFIMASNRDAFCSSFIFLSRPSYIFITLSYCPWLIHQTEAIFSRLNRTIVSSIKNEQISKSEYDIRPRLHCQHLAHELRERLSRHDPICT